MGFRRESSTFRLGLLAVGVAAAAFGGPLVTTTLLDDCPALLAAGGVHAAKLAEDLERQLRIAMAWPVSGRLVAAEFPTTDGVPTYTVRSTHGMGAVLRVLVPGQSEATLAQEAKALELGWTLELGPKPLQLGLPGVLAMHDVPGNPVESVTPAPVKAMTAALRTLHGFTGPAVRDLPAKSYLNDLLSAADRAKVEFGTQAGTVRQRLLRLARLLAAEGAPARVPSVRSMPPGLVRIDAGGSLRFAMWREAGMADPFEDYGRAAELLKLGPTEAKDFLGKLLRREPESWEQARLTVYRALFEAVPNPERATIPELLRLVPLLGSEAWERSMTELVP